jgi:hypothetical protein
LAKFVQAQCVELNYSEKIGPAKGLSHGVKITLLCGMQAAQEFSTLVHEIALCWGQHNQDYIQLWHGDAKLLRESLEAVQRTAAVILGRIAAEPTVAG